MIKLFHFFVFGLLVSLIFNGCATNPDPSEGGIIDGIAGLSKGTYQRRQDEKQAELNEIEKNNIVLNEQTNALENRHQTLEQLRQTYADELVKLENELNNLELKLFRTRAKNTAALAKKRELTHELNDLQEKIKREKKFIKNSSEGQMREEYKQLLNDKRRLQKQITELAAM